MPDYKPFIILVYLLKKRTHKPKKMKKLILQTIAVIIFTITCITSDLKTVSAQDLQKKYKIVNRMISSEGEVIHMNEVEGVGIAWINGKIFTQGAIEFDVKGKDELQRSFVGIAFHGLNDTTYEAIYFRPFNFRATDPARKAHAVQYIAYPNYDWPKLRADFPNKYEQPVSSDLDPNQWFHVKISVSGKMISVYVNGNAQPALSVESLARIKGKMIGYWVGNNSGGDWKNLKIVSIHDN
jgi:hypothetical protein